MDIRLYPPEAQGRGVFDGGRITEIKPIGFPHEGPMPPHLGPLFYWAWAVADGYGKIALHPHKAFEIMSYALKGEIGHYDTLGHKSRVKTGGAQVMQTGSGVAHEEETLGDRTELFQIWFEPDLEKAVQQAPTYREFPHEVFPIATKDGVAIKTVIGKGAPVTLVTDAAMQDITVQAGKIFERELSADRSLAIVAIAGQGFLLDEAAGQKNRLQEKDFAVVYAKSPGKVSFHADPDSEFRLAVIEVPATVEYPLYRSGGVRI